MFAASSLFVAWAFMVSPAGADWPPRTTIEELNAMVKAGNYHLIRRQKLGHQIEAVGRVAKAGDAPVGNVPLLTLSVDKYWAAFLHNIPKDHGLKPGDRVKFRALIVDEAYSALQLWAYAWSKEPADGAARDGAPPELKPAARPSTAASEAFPLAGGWLLTMPRGFEYDAILEPAGEAGLYRLRCGALNLQGLYEAREKRLTLVKPDNKFLANLGWEIHNKNALVLTTQPNQAQVGSDYRGATLGRQKRVGRTAQ